MLVQVSVPESASELGRRPIAAFGNSDGDLQMLQSAMAGEGPRFALFVPSRRRPARIRLRPDRQAAAGTRLSQSPIGDNTSGHRGAACTKVQYLTFHPAVILPLGQGTFDLQPAVSLNQRNAVRERPSSRPATKAAAQV